MNDLNLDRDLRTLFAAGPRAVPAAVVDQAIAGAHSVQQRRPRFAVLDARAWPPQARSAADPSVHRALRVLAVGALILLLGVAVAVGARLLDRPPSVTIVTAGTLDSVLQGPRLELWPDGRILVGDQNGWDYLFDPATGASEPFGFGADWNLAQVNVLPDERVVLTQGRASATGGQESIDVAFYDRATATVNPLGSFATPWFASTTLVLRDGRILISGGVVFPSSELPCGPLVCEGGATPAPTAPYETAEGAKDTVRLFDPATGATTDIGHLQVGRFQHQLVELQDGRILVVGGFDYQTDATGSGEALEMEVFDLSTGTSKVVGALKPGFYPVWPAPVRLDDGRILLADARLADYPCGIPTLAPGQHVEQIHTVVTQLTRVFDPATDQLTDGPTMPHFVGANMVALPHDRALAFGLYYVYPASCSSESDPVPNSWLGVADLAHGTTFETYNPITGIASLDVAATQVYGAAIRLPDGRVALITDDYRKPQKNVIDIVTIGP